MSRTSDKHGSRVDAGLKSEVGPPPVSGDGHWPPGSLPDGEIKRRQQLGRFLERKFPATREEILESAIEIHAPPEVIDQLHELPSGTYEGFPQIWEALDGEVEGERS